MDKVARKLLRPLVLKIAHIFGTRFIDFESGELLGKALIIPWRGKIHVIGLEALVKPVFQPQKRLNYWKQEIVFVVPGEPDFPNEREPT